MFYGYLVRIRASFKKEFLKPWGLCAGNREKVAASTLQPRKQTAHKASAVPEGNR